MRINNISVTCQFIHFGYFSTVGPEQVNDSIIDIRYAKTEQQVLDYYLSCQLCQ